ncbi:MAG: hypothetical protein LKE61_01425 [Erysipelotrichaceae bacterium]|jgi:hypothetical protein|nr:hypothetical protein [Erysipelotrichaceae bacterium]MCI1327272.1 hypothetical protein [Solobacterium sp.]MCH4045481.1 hypothetical protein [Erysipelotrichaceae bacterium]MCH4122691.1 hypothetical protein [Erysipelotrichaceae bacterium]MCI1385808.1 hypothetical protein [Solobacterium sp.]
MKKLIKLAAAGIMAASLAACGSSSTTAAATKAAESTAAATATTVPTEGHYNITNATGEKVTALYVYKTGSSDKGTNYAENGLDDGASVKVDVKVDEKDASGYMQTVEFTTESGDTEDSFQTLSLEEADFSLVKVADLSSSATQQNVTFNKDASAVKAK